MFLDSLLIFRSGGQGPVKVHSVEVWQGGNLVAGEIGVAVGACFVSYSGYSEQPSSGTVQCITLGAYLQSKGFKLWDLGMGMAYKHRLGAQDTPRLMFLARLRKVRAEPVQPLPVDPFPCALMFPARGKEVSSDLPVAPYAPKPLPQRNPESKRQRKYRAKKERKAEFKAAKRAARQQQPVKPQQASLDAADAPVAEASFPLPTEVAPQ
jgi:hypothetical protein